MAFLYHILNDTEREIAEAKRGKSGLNMGDLKRKIRDTPPVRSFADSLSKGFGLIAEIKRKSPSAGEMRRENFDNAPEAYDKSPVVRALSVLTNYTHFGMRIEEMLDIKSRVRQPILRKDFILKEYQIYQSRAFGADAVLLMANVLSGEKMRRFYELAQELGLDALFEAHTEEEIASLPAGATVCGINSRNFMASNRWLLAKVFTRMGLWRSGHGPDPSVDLQTFSLIKYLPRNAIKVAESGVKPGKIDTIMDLGYDAVLVGTSLLKAPEGIHEILAEFEAAVRQRTNHNAPLVAAATA